MTGQLATTTKHPIDLYNDGVVPTGELDLGTLELTAGEHKLSVEITGANEKPSRTTCSGLIT